MKKVVLTGATGFLGFALLKELVRENIIVYALCRKNSRRLSRLDELSDSNVKIIEADLSRIQEIDGVSDCDVFYHLAWEGERNNFEQQYKNVDISVNCLKLAAKLGCKRFVCTGSQAEYGNVKGLITEETPINPETSYGAAKAAVYYLTKDLAKRLWIEHTWVRVFSVYGEHDNANTLYSQMSSALRAGKEFQLTTDGTHIWNYLHEDDAAKALRLLGCNSRSDTVYNLASRVNKPLKEFVDDFRRIVGGDTAVRYDAGVSSVNLCVDTGRIRSEVGEFETTTFPNLKGERTYG